MRTETWNIRYLHFWIFMINSNFVHSRTTNKSVHKSTFHVNMVDLISHYRYHWNHIQNYTSNMDRRSIAHETPHNFLLVSCIRFLQKLKNRINIFYYDISCRLILLWYWPTILVWIYLTVFASFRASRSKSLIPVSTFCAVIRIFLAFVPIVFSRVVL